MSWINKSQQRQLDRMRRAAGFGARHEKEFAETSRGRALFIELVDLLNEIESAGPSSLEDPKRGPSPLKQKALEALQDNLEHLARTAELVVSERQDLSGKFVLPDKRRKREWPLAARQFITEAEPVWDEFCAYELPPGFLEDLRAQLEEYEAPTVKPAVILKDALIRANQVLQSLDVLVHNKYQGQQHVLKEWAATSS